MDCRARDYGARHGLENKIIVRMKLYMYVDKFVIDADIIYYYQLTLSIQILSNEFYIKHT